jgi:hypothetical protein
LREPVTQKGIAIRMKPERAGGLSALAAMAIETMKSWRFTPAAAQGTRRPSG